MTGKALLAIMMTMMQSVTYLLPSKRLNVTCPDARTFDSSGMGPGEDSDPGVTHDGLLLPVVAAINSNVTAPDGTRVVHHLSLDFFRCKLVEHFNILWQKGDVKWPESSTRKPTL